MRPRFALALVLLLAAVPSLAQNRYFADGANGVTVQGGWVTVDDADGFGGAVAMTFNGRFDVGISYVAPEMEIADGDTRNWEQIAPRLAIAVVRPKPGYPVGVDVAAAYTSSRFGGTLQDLAGGDAQSLGVDVYGRFGAERAVQIIPAFGVHYQRSESWFRQAVDDAKLTMEESGPMVGVECTLVFHERFLVIPGTVTFKGDTTWSIMAGFALAMR